MSDAPRRLRREEVAARDLGGTMIDPRAAWITSLLFLLVIGALPVVDVIADLARERAGGPALAEVARIPGAAADGWATESEAWWGQRCYAANAAALAAMSAWETELTDSSLLARRLRQPMQTLFSGVFGIGNEQAYVGRADWLFYRQDVDACTGPPFLAPEQLRLRSLSGSEYEARVQPDPRPAITAFRDQLATHGIRLIVLPVPVKPAIHPEYLAGGSHERALLNASYPDFLADLRAAEVDVLDLAEPMLARKDALSEPLYLRTDTHWTAATARWVAGLVADRIAPEREPVAVPSETITVRNHGDVLHMLELPAEQTIFPLESQRVQRPDFAALPDGHPRVLLLGDSFCNIYSQGGLGWGEGAGLGEQLAAELGAPVRTIAINAGGSHAARGELLRRLERGEAVLAGIEVVVWQFATRELAQGDWRHFELPADLVTTAPVAAADEPEETAASADLAITATIQDLSRAPRPGTVPYRDCLIALHLSDIAGPGAEELPAEVLVYAWGLRDNEPRNAGLRAGQRGDFTLRAWSTVRDELGSLNREELDSDAALFLDLYWAETTP